MFRSIRIDIGDRDEHNVLKYVEDFLNSCSSKYVLYREVASKTKKLHFQGIFETDMDPKRFGNKLRSYFTEFKKHEKSFAPVKTEDSYKKYIKKDGNQVLIKGFTEDEISSWGDWEHKVQCKTETPGDIFYRKFIVYVQEQPDYEIKVRSFQWIAGCLFDFVGGQDRVFMFNFYKSVVYTAHARFAQILDSVGKQKTKEDWVDRLFSA